MLKYQLPTPSISYPFQYFQHHIRTVTTPPNDYQSINTASSIPDLQIMHHSQLHTKAIATENDTIKYGHIYGIHHTHFYFRSAPTY